MKTQQRSKRLWRFLLAFVSLACLIGSRGTLHADDLIWEDQSNASIYNIPGENSEHGEQLNYWHFWMNKTRILVERAVLSNRSFTFVGSGANDGYMSLRYFWSEGSLATNPDKNQHSEGSEIEILKPPGGAGPRFWTFRPCVFKNRLYFFFASEKRADTVNGLEDGTIYYMGANPADQGTALKFEGKDSIQDALSLKKKLPGTFFNHRRICATGVMNGKMYVIAAECVTPDAGEYLYNWSVTSTTDGEHWAEWKVLKERQQGFPQSAAVFFVNGANSESASERMVLAAVEFNDSNPEQSRPVLWLCDGQKLYGKQYPTGNTQNILVATGTVKGSVNDRPVIQIWRTAPGALQKPVFHAQYAPGGPEGDQGHFVLNSDGGMWKEIVQNGYWTARTDPWNGFDDPAVRFWTHKRALEGWATSTVFTGFQNNKSEMQQYIDLTFFQRWVYWFGKGDRPYVKTLRYESDRMKPSSAVTRPLDSSASSYEGEKEPFRDMWVLLGVIEGPPPVPSNGNKLSDLGLNTSATVGKSKTETFVQTAKYQQKFTVTVGVKAGSEEKKLGAEVGVGVGGHWMQEYQEQKSLTSSMDTTITIDTTSIPASDDVGQLVVMKPTVENKQFKLYGYDGEHPLGLTLNALSVSKAKISFESYSLTHPEKDWHSKGMKARYLTTDYVGWAEAAPELNNEHSRGYEAEGVLQVGKGKGRSTVALQETQSKTDTTSSGVHMGVKAGVSIKFFNVGAEGKFSWDWATTNTTTLDDHVSWTISLPPMQDKSGVEEIRVQPYFLQALSTNDEVEWIPKFFREKGNKPWCITYHVIEARRSQTQSAGFPAAESSGESAFLSVALPMGGGSVTSTYLKATVSASDGFTVGSADTIDLRAEPKRGYAFQKWVVAGTKATAHGPLDSPETWVVLNNPGGINTVEPVFERVLPTVTVQLQDSDPSASYVDVSGCYLDDKLLKLKPTKDDLSVYINGYQLPCNGKRGVWTKTQSGWEYSSNRPGDFLLTLDFDSMTWSFYSKDDKIHRTMITRGNNLKLGLRLNQKSYGEHIEAEVKYSFKTRRFSPATTEDYAAANLSQAPAGLNAKKARAPFKVLKLEGSYDGSAPHKNTIVAEGKAGDLKGLDQALLKRHGIIAFYAGDATLLKARISHFVHRKNDTYSFKDKSHQMTVDFKKGVWSLKVSGTDTDVITDELLGVYMIIYEDSPSGPGMNLGLGNKNLKVLWGDADLNLLQTVRNATLTYKGR